MLIFTACLNDVIWEMDTLFKQYLLEREGRPDEEKIQSI